MNNLTIKPNEKQLECINNIEGKFLALAGPGTGKTFTLVQRIKFMLLNGIREEKILCLTFSDSAAMELRQRLEKELKKTSLKVSIFTYHSFCNEIISENPLEYNLAEDYRVINKSTSRQLIKETIEEINPVEYRSSKNDPYVFIKSILEQIEEIKKNRLTKEKYFNNIEKNPDFKPQIEVLNQKLTDYQSKGKKVPKYVIDGIEAQKKKIQKAVELWDFYESYKSKMDENYYIDFYDMINLVLEKFELEPSYAHKISNKFDYILVDEYQDTNKNQNQLILNLIDANDKKNIFLAGDDDQIIYTFQGAKKDTIENFLTLNPDTKVICLKDNMRSTKSILEASRGIILQDSTRLEVNPKFFNYNISKELKAKNETLADKKIVINKYYDINQEYSSIIAQIEDIINSKNCPKNLSQIAILAKTNPELEKIAQELKNKNIPFELKEGRNIFEIKAGIVFYYYLKTLVNPELYSNDIFKLLLLEPFNINPKDYCKLYQKKANNKSFLDSMREIKDFCDKEKIDNYIKTYDYLKNFLISESTKDIVLEAGVKSGIFDYYLNCSINRVDNTLALKKIVDEAIDFSNTRKNITLYDFIDYLDTCYKEQIPIRTEKPPFSLNAIQLSTYHSAKGREFEIVFLPTLIKRYWEKDRNSNKPIIPLDISEYKTQEELEIEKLTDKTKLLYVGFTRAKHTLILSYCKTLNSKEEELSDFVYNIKDKLIENDYSELNNDNYYLECKNSLNKKTYDYKRDFNSFVDETIAQKPFSISAVNVYLKCPRQYLYSNILDLTSRYQKDDSLYFGSSIHTALEFCYKFALENKKYPAIESLIEVFNKELNKCPISSFAQKKILLERGKNALIEFYPQITSTRIDKVQFVEYPILCEEKDFTFKGIIDRIDKNEDGSYSIIDYKTGSAKSKNSICFNGKKEDYYLQLALYKHFFEKTTNNLVKDINIIFVESKNNISLTLDKQDLEKAYEKFKNAVFSIKNREFEPKFNRDNCKYCKFKDFCMLDVV